MRKDSVYALELAHALHLSLPAMQTVSQRMSDLCTSGLADQDYTALAKPYQV
jgi:3-hydroxyisobutyrate dehydrogenase-like beta-hydroxyacid dehydrogenase